MKKIYVGCSLAHAPKEYIQAITSFKKSLAAEFEVLDFAGLTAKTAREVYLKDTNCVRKCDLFVAECTYPSTGLGIEISLALSLDKPIIALAKNESNVSRMVTGIEKKNFTFLRYEELEQAVGMVRQEISRLTS